MKNGEKSQYEMFMEDASSFTHRAGPKLSTAQQSAIFVAAQHYPQRIVSKAFGVTDATVSAIANCISSGRYKHVREAWEALGEEAFYARYFTEDMRLKLVQAKYDALPAAKQD